MRSSRTTYPSALRRGLPGGIAVAVALALSACGGGDSGSSKPSAVPTMSPTPGPIAADRMESCLKGKGLSLNTDKKKADGARFGADLELQISITEGSSYLGVFVYPDPTAATAGRDQIAQAAGAGSTEIVNNSVLVGASDYTTPAGKADVDKVRSCAATGS